MAFRIPNDDLLSKRVNSRTAVSLYPLQWSVYLHLQSKSEAYLRRFIFFGLEDGVYVPLIFVAFALTAAASDKTFLKVLSIES